VSGSSARSRSGLGLVIAMVGGLGLAGASLAGWVQRVRTDDVAGVAVETVDVTLGVALAPLALPLGIVAAVLGFGLAVRREVVRRGVAAALLLVGLAALISVGIGVLRAVGLEGEVSTGAFVAVLAALAVAGAGVLALRPSSSAPPSLSARYDLDADDEDREWDLASADDEDPGGDPADPRRPRRPGKP
jgi:hypothetical protein